jgi:N-methylhydantoinase A
MAQRLRIAVDIGGTFTDGVASLHPAGDIWVGKTPTTPEDPGAAVSNVVAQLLEQVARDLPGARPELAEVVHGTTLITNTLIERKGAATALVTTRGQADVLELAREGRYDAYDLDIVRPAPLVETCCRVELDERIDARGRVLEALQPADLDSMVDALKRMGVQSVAISLLHAYTNDTHERAVAQRLEQALPGLSVSVSSEVAPEINEYERTSTAAANAYVKPIVADYLRELQARIDSVQRGTPLRVMVSSGGFVSAQAGAQAPIQLLESGPAAGVLSALNVARLHGVEHVVAFDMGGTTAKASVLADGVAPIAHGFECARVDRFQRGSGLPILIPSIELIEIGAGGGSIAHENALGLLGIGPESSGSVPGPACYGRGGLQPTVTDADLLLGYLDADNFLGGEMTLRTDLAWQAMERLGRQLGIEPDAVVCGIANLVNENMAAAARIHIAERGFDPRDFCLIATGGAGPVHAVDVARKLRIGRVLVPIAAGAGSCLGMLAAPARVDRAWSRPQLLAEVDWGDVRRRLDRLRSEASEELARAGAHGVTWHLGAEMRFHGQGATLSVAIPYDGIDGGTSAALLAAFEAQYLQLYGRLVRNAQAQVITWRLTGKAVTEAHRYAWADGRTRAGTALRGERRIYLPVQQDWRTVPVYDRYAIAPGTALAGPLILEERESTIVVAVAATVQTLADHTVSVSLEEFD